MVGQRGSDSYRRTHRGVTSVGAGAFTGLQKPDGGGFRQFLKEIGASAFQGCEGLTKISLPASFRRFGASSFEGCTNLTEVYCSGGMPSFNANCLWNGNNITIYCPVNNIWPSEYVEELETNFHGPPAGADRQRLRPLSF